MGRLMIFTPDRQFTPNLAYVRVFKRDAWLRTVKGQSYQADAQSFVMPSSTTMGYEVDLWRVQSGKHSMRHMKPWDLPSLSRIIKQLIEKYDEVQIFVSDYQFPGRDVSKECFELRHWDFSYAGTRATPAEVKLFSQTAIDAVLVHFAKTNELPCVLQLKPGEEPGIDGRVRVMYNVATFEESKTTPMKKMEGTRR